MDKLLLRLCYTVYRTVLPLCYTLRISRAETGGLYCLAAETENKK